MRCVNIYFHIKTSWASHVQFHVWVSTVLFQLIENQAIYYFNIQVYFCVNSVAFGIISMPGDQECHSQNKSHTPAYKCHHSPPSIQNGKTGLPDLDSQINRNFSNIGLLERIKIVKHVMLSSMELFTIIIPSQCRGYSSRNTEELKRRQELAISS
jgi:hypothetical protein